MAAPHTYATLAHPGRAHYRPFLRMRSIDHAVAAARGYRRYQAGDEWVTEEFRRFRETGQIEPWQLAVAKRVVKQSPGWFMPKHEPPGFAPIPPQLRPDTEVITSGDGETWHYHGPVVNMKRGGWSPLWGWEYFPEESRTKNGKRAGKPLPRRFILGGASADAHINKKGDPYNPVTGEGAHNGENIDYVHRHVNRARYVLLGKCKRIDLHPWALERLPESEIVFFGLEGTPKNDSMLTEILEYDLPCSVFSVPSVTLWDGRELAEFADKYLRGKTVLVVPDGDWFENPQVERHALKARSYLRRLGLGIDAYVCAPPYDTVDKWKGVDDFLGSGHNDLEELHTLDDLELVGREVDATVIHRAVRDIDYHRAPRARQTLEDLSLYANRKEDDDGNEKPGQIRMGFQSLRKLLGINDWRKVVPRLEDIRHTYTIEEGSLEVIAEWRPHCIKLNGRKVYIQKEEHVWKEPPTISLREEYHSQLRRQRLLATDFWQRLAIEEIRGDVDDLKRWRRERELQRPE